MATITKMLDNYTPPAPPRGRKYKQGKSKARQSAIKANIPTSGGWMQQWASKGY